MNLCFSYLLTQPPQNIDCSEWPLNCKLFITKQGGSAEVKLEDGKMIRVSLDPAHASCGNKDCIFADYANMKNVLEVDGIIYIDDGLISLQVKSIGRWISLSLCTPYSPLLGLRN